MNEKRQLLYTCIIVCTIIAGILTGIWLNRLSAEPTTTNTAPRLVPIYYVQTDEKKLAISFDAAWGCEHTQAILDVLDQYHIKATFFLTNIWLDAYPDMAKTIADHGHEIAMHSVSHPHMPSLTTTQMEQELQGNYQSIQDITQYTPKLFRFPFGDYDNQSIQLVQNLGYYPIQWSIDSLDWMESKTKDDIVNRVILALHNGAIILCHNNGTHTADAMAEIIPYAIDQGYQFVPIGQLIYPAPYTTDHNGMQQPSS